MTITPNVNLYFDIDTKQVSVTDSTSWPTINNIPVSEILNLKGLGTLTSPSGGVVFTATNPTSPLIDIADGDQYSQSYNLPVASGDIVVGTYTLNYDAQGGYTQSALAIGRISNLGYIEVNDSGYGAFLLQAGDVVNIAGSPIPSNNGNWTVSSAEVTGSSVSRIYLTRTGDSLVTDNSGDAELTYTIERTYATNLSPAYTGCSKVTPAITFVSQPYTGEFGTLVVTDATNYGNTTVLNKTLSVLYPDGLFPAPETNPVVGEDVTSVTLLQVATGTYTITLNGIVIVTPVNGLGFSYLISNIRVNGRPVNVFERVVVWNGDLCSIYDCVSIVFDKHNRFVLQGQESPYTAAVADLSLAINRYMIAVQCGVQDDITAAFSDINAILQSTDCNCGCDTESNNPVWISNSSQEGENLITNLQDQIDALAASITGFNDAIEAINNELTTKLSEVFHTDQFSGSGTEADPLEIVDLDANLVSISPGISGLDSQSLWLALSDLQLNKLESVRRDATQFTGSGAIGSPLTIIEVNGSLVTGMQAFDVGVSPISGLSSTQVQGALSELQSFKLSRVYGSDFFSGLGTLADPLQLEYLNAPMVLITPSIAGLDATDVQGALTEMVPKLVNYTEYVAKISQTGTNAPTATVISNTLDLTPTISFSYINVGNYFVSASFPSFPIAKTVVSITQGNAGTAFVSADVNTTTNIQLYTRNSAGAFANSLIQNTFLTIRVYA
jgi:hypothetical protein